MTKAKRNEDPAAAPERVPQSLTKQRTSLFE